jgi:hypothetical protein
LKNNRTIVDFTYKFNGSGTGAKEAEATITFDTTGEGYHNPLAMNEMCGTITIYNPMRDAIPVTKNNHTEDVRKVKGV